MTLRQSLIETMAQAGYEGDAWDHADEMQRILWRVDAKIKLDALLSFLSDNGDEWSHQGTIAAFGGDLAMEDGLIAVLRDDQTSEDD